MTHRVRPALADDEDWLWQMLFFASHSDEEAGTGIEDVRRKPELARYASGFGRDGDVGVIAIDGSNEPSGAAWVRLLTGAERGYGWVSDSTPELAIAVAPSARGRGVGTLMLAELLARAFERFDAVSLSVRMNNPARRLYERLGFELVSGSEKPNRVGGTSAVMLARAAKLPRSARGPAR